jgi:hypothetical protein
MSAVAKSKVVPLAAIVPEWPVGLLPWEDADSFQTLRNQMIAAHTPRGSTESSLVERLVWCEWRRRRLLAAEAAVHVAHCSDRSHDSQAKVRLLQRAGVADYKARDEISLPDVLRGNDQDDAETIAAIREGIADAEATIALVDAGASLKDAEARMDEDLRDWWRGELDETDDKDQPKYANSAEGLKRFLSEDALPWRRGWLTVNAARPAIRAQAIAESFDPARLRQLWDMEARLDRQFEKSLGMLIRLQEMRTTPSPVAEPGSGS